MSNIPRDKPFYEFGDWIEILANVPLRQQPKDIFRRFVRESIEDSYRREYYIALVYMDVEGPDWEDLTDEVRKNIRNQQITHAQALQAFGVGIANGDDIDILGKRLIK
jgi:hypothetical protein